MNRTNPVLKDQVIEQTRDIPGLSSLPGVPIKTVKTWCARRPDAAAHDQFSHGPAKSLDDLGMVPEGHFVIGYTKDDEMIVGGIIIDGDLEWNYVAEKERLDAANHFLETLDFPEELSHIPMTTELEQMTKGSGHCEWQFDGMEDQRFRDILVLKDGDATPVEMSLFLRFAEFSTEIVCAELDGVDITPKNVQGDVDAPGDVDVPGGDNNSPGEDCGPEPC